MAEGQANASMTPGRVTIGDHPYTGTVTFPGGLAPGSVLTLDPSWTASAIEPETTLTTTLTPEQTDAYLARCEEESAAYAERERRERIAERVFAALAGAPFRIGVGLQTEAEAPAGIAFEWADAFIARTAREEPSK